MPRRNLLWLTLVCFASLACYYKATPSRYGRALGDVFSRVSHRYYQPIEDPALFEAAVKGMMSRLDKNSSFIPPQQKHAFEEEITKEFAGVGMEVEVDAKTRQIVVRSPLIGAPAYEAGIRAGDRILKVDGRSAEGMPVQEALKLIRGQPGTTVVLTVLHEGQTQPSDISIVRNVIQEDTIRGDTRNPDGSWNFMLPGQDRIGYIRLTGFAEAEKTNGAGRRVKTTVADLEKAMGQLADAGMRGLVLDMRDNPGGSLAAAIEVCRLFVPPGVILTTRGRDGQVLRSFQTKQAGPYTDFPMAVLVNQNSASASEIVAACLQDYHRAIVVGQRSYGKGTVQEVTDLGDEFGALKLTVATYWRPSGRNIHHHADDDSKSDDWGVTPDDGYNVPVGEEERERYRRWRMRRDGALTVESNDEPADKSGDKPTEKGKPFVDRPLAAAVAYLEKTLGG